MRKEFTRICRDRIAKRDDLFVLLGDIGVGGFLDDSESLVDSVLNMGIAEQSMICFAAGLNDATNKNVIVHTISAFLLERAFEQIKNCIAYNRRKLILVAANGPFDYSKLGPTHHCPNDVALMRMIDGIDIYLPSSSAELNYIFDRAFDSSRSSYIRLTNRSANIQPVESGWRKFFIIDGQIRTELPPDAADIEITYITVGEGLAFILSNIASDKPVEVIHGFGPCVHVDSKLVSAERVVILEPYTTPVITLKDQPEKLVVTRRLFSIDPKKVILEDLGWEDFRDA